MDKQKADADRGRMEDFRARLDSAAAFVSGHFPEEDAARIRMLLISTAESTKNVSVSSFDVTGIDRRIDDILQKTEKIIQNGGSSETVLRSLQGIAYGILNGHGAISSTANVSDVLRNRETMLDRYLQSVSYSFDIDRKKMDIRRLEEAKQEKELEYQKAMDELQKMIDSDHKTYYQIEGMLPSQLDQVTGASKAMATQMSKTVKLNKNIRQIDLAIGQKQQEINTLEDNCNGLFLQLSSWEPEVDEQSAEEMNRLTEEFNRELLKQKEIMKKMENASDVLDKAINQIFAGQDEIETEISAYEKFQKMKRRQELDAQKEKEAGLRYAKEQEEKKLEAEKQESEERKLDSREMYYC